jgi:tetratricopeptide (TPR) repeat protein
VSSDFLKPQRNTLRYPTDFLIGDLLVRAGVITAKQLDEAIRLAGNKHVQVGQMLVMARHLTQHSLQAAVDAQSAVRDRTIDMNTAVKSLKSACRSGLTFADALHADQYGAKEVATNKLGELLLEAGLITRDGFAKAYQRSLSTGLPLGRMLVLNGAISDPLLTTSLEIQVRVRDEMISRDEAVQQLFSMNSEGAEPISVEQVAAILQSLKPPRQKKIRLGELLVLAGMLDETDVMNALELGLCQDLPIGQIFVGQGFLSDDTLDAALKLQDMVETDSLDGHQAAQALRKVQETGLPVEEVVQQLGQVIDQQTVQTEIPFETLLTLARIISEEEIHHAIELVRATPEILGKVLALTGYVPEISGDAAVRCHWLINNGYLNQDDALVALDFCLQKQTEAEITFDEALEELGWSVAPAEEAVAETAAPEEESHHGQYQDPYEAEMLTESLHPSENEEIHKEEISKDEISNEVTSHEEKPEEPAHEPANVVAHEESQPEILHQEERPEEQQPEELQPKALEPKALEIEQPEELQPKEIEQPEILQEAPQAELPSEVPQPEEIVAEETPKAQPSLAKMESEHSYRSSTQTMDELPAIGQAHGFLNEALSEPFEELEMVQTPERSVEKEEELVVAESFSAVPLAEAESLEELLPEWDDGPELVESLESQFAAHTNGHADSEEEKVGLVVAGKHDVSALTQSEPVVDKTTEQRASALIKPMGGAAKAAPTGNGSSQPASTTGKGAPPPSDKPPVGGVKGMSLKSLLQSYSSGDEEPAVESPMAKLGPEPAKPAAKKEQLKLSEEDQAILAAASSLSASPEEIKKAAYILQKRAGSKTDLPAADSATKAGEAAAKTESTPVKPAPAKPAAETPAKPVPAPLKPTVRASATRIPAMNSSNQAPPSTKGLNRQQVEQAVELREEMQSVLGEAFVRLAESYYEQGNYIEAEKLYQRILAMREKEVGLKSPALLNDLNNLAGVMCVQGKFCDAEVFVQRSVNIVETYEPENILKLADGINTLAGIYFQQNKNEQCEPLLERSLRLRQRALGAEHPDIADNLRDYAKFLKKIGRTEEAEKMYGQAKGILAKAIKKAEA